MKAAIVIMFLATMTVAKHHHRNLRKSFEAKDFFIKINDDIHGLMEKMFDSMNLHDNFTKQPNVKKLLIMHYDLSNIAEKNIESFHDIQNASQVSNINQTEDRVRLDNVVEQILKENKIDVHEQINRKKRKPRHEKHKIKIKSIDDNSELHQTEELVDFVVDFLDQANNVSMQDLRKSSKRRRPISNRRNLKVWEPPQSLNLELNGKARRMFNGIKTTIKKFPFIVSIHLLGDFACAGSIISRDFVITAAACLQEAYDKDSQLNPKSIYVRLGSDYTSRAGETIPIQELYFHPGFDPEILNNNLVLVKLEKRIRFSRQQNKIRRILYDTAVKAPDPSEDGVFIIGWGATAEDQIVNRNQHLSLDKLDMFDWDSCKKLYSKNYVNHKNFCAGMSEKAGGACNGDVGGPGVVGQVLMGIVSFGAPDCGSTDAPTVFIKIGYYAKWIESILNPKPERRQSMTWRKPFARRNIGTSNKNRIYNSKISKKKFRVEDDYPEEVTVLKEILGELVKTNTDMVDELLYGDLYEDFNDIFVSKEKPNILNHELVNKSIYPIPEVHYNTHREYVTMKLTTSPRTPTLSTPENAEMLRKPEFESASQEYTDNYEGSSSEQGMSIEVFTTVTRKIYTNSKSTKHYKKTKIKTTTTTLATESTYKSKHKQKHHTDTTTSIASKAPPKATRLTAPPRTPISDSVDIAYYDKERFDKIDETKAVALKVPEDYAEEIKADKKEFVKNDNIEDQKELVQEQNNYNLVDNDNPYIIKNEKTMTTKNNVNEKGNQDNDNEVLNDKNEIAHNLDDKNELVIDEINNDSYNDDKIIIESNNNKLVNEENIQLGKNNIRILADNQINTTDDNKKEDSQNVKPNTKKNIGKDDFKAAPMNTGDESEESSKVKKNTVETDDKSAVRNLKDLDETDNSNDHKQDSVEKYQNVTFVSSIDESQRSDEYSFTPYTPFVGTHMDVEYITIGWKVEGGNIKRKKVKEPSSFKSDIKLPNFHAMPKHQQPEKTGRFWEAFLNMKLIP